MSEWEEATLGELIDIKHGYAFKGEYFTETPNGNVLLTPRNFHIGGGFKDGKFKYYMGDIPEDYILKSGDVIVTMTDLSKSGDTLGYSARVPSSADHRFLHNQRLGLVTTKSTKADINFIYWLLRTHHYQKTIVNSCSGSTVKHTSPSKIKDYVFLLPPIEEQQAIDAILSYLDRKISNLRKQNETLEKIAQTLFKHWFIDFEFPNEDGKPYKSSGGAMEPSELGEIPAVWRVGKLGNVADVTSSKRIFRSEYVESGIPFYRSKEIIELSSGQGISTPLYISPERFVEIKEKFGAPEAGEVLVTSVGTIGVIYIVTPEDKFYFKDGNLTWIKNFRDGFNGVFIYFWLKSDATKIQIEKNTIGSTQRALTIQALGGLKLIIPLPQVLSDYRDFVGSVHNKKEINTQQIRTLTQTRDVLLPKLMSGKLRIQES